MTQQITTQDAANLVVVPSSTTSTALANLARYAAEARGAYSPNTERAMQADSLVFSGWCAPEDRAALPASAETLAAFIDAMGATKAPATVRRYVASISHMHRAAEVENPAASGAVQNALKRLHREKGRTQAQAAPLNREKVLRMLEAAGTTPRGLRNRAILAVSYDTLCRRAEIVALRREDVEAAGAEDGTVKVRKSKSDQEGAGMIRYLAPDTMRELVAWLKVAKIEDGFLFRTVGKSGAIGGQLDAGDVARIFKRMAKDAGLTAPEVARISGHSSRVGAAQDMVRHGVELPAVMQAGGWRTPEMVSRYTQRLEARRSGAAKLAILQNRV